MFQAKPILRDYLRKISASRSGGVLIYLAFALPILLGAMALSIDLGRAFILNTELKDFSDAAALAGAAELDKADGAIARAELAARTGLSGTLVNVQAFATDGSGPNIIIKPGQDGIVFLKNLPADGTDFTAADTATSDADARFIFVSVVNRNVRSGLSRALGVIPEFNTSARSIAGRGNIMCEVPAMFMCNPLEADGTNGTEIFPLDGTPCTIANLGMGKPLKEVCLKGRQMKMRSGGGGQQRLHSG
jgi:Flp pilus assembly protein TadG